MKYSFPAFENGFIRAAAASPALRVADCVYNAEQIIGVMREYAEKNVQLLCLPEFALTPAAICFCRTPCCAGRRTASPPS